MMNKRGVIDQLVPMVIGLVVVGVVLVVGFLILANIKTQTIQQDAITYGALCNATSPTGCGQATNSTLTTITAMAGVPGWLGVIIIVVIGTLLIGLVSMFNRRNE